VCLRVDLLLASKIVQYCDILILAGEGFNQIGRQTEQFLGQSWVLGLSLAFKFAWDGGYRKYAAPGVACIVWMWVNRDA
jgi:hypothetical protein